MRARIICVSHSTIPCFNLDTTAMWTFKSLFYLLDSFNFIHFFLTIHILLSHLCSNALCPFIKNKASHPHLYLWTNSASTSPGSLATLSMSICATFPSQSSTVLSDFGPRDFMFVFMVS